jgi:ABC-type amino acid transport system permease subunit
MASQLKRLEGTKISTFLTNFMIWAVFAILWLGFAGLLVFSRGSLDSIWQTFRALPLLVQLVGWLLFLPVTLGLWIWETQWPMVLRLLLVASLAIWNATIFFPKR